MRTRATFLALLITAVALAAPATSAAGAKEYVLKHPKHEHCKPHYVKKSKTLHQRVHGHTVTVRETVCVYSPPTKPQPSPSSKSAKLEECSAIVSGAGPVGETHLYAYQVILSCRKGEFSSFQVSTNRTIAAGSVTAQLGTTYKYTCAQPSSTSFSCNGVSASIPSGEEGTMRAFFKSAQPVCEGGASELATITTEGETFVAKIDEVQSPC
jgi:hypothetical protein